MKIPYVSPVLKNFHVGDLKYESISENVEDILFCNDQRMIILTKNKKLCHYDFGIPETLLFLLKSKEDFRIEEDINNIFFANSRTLISLNTLIEYRHTINNSFNFSVTVYHLEKDYCTESISKVEKYCFPYKENSIKRLLMNPDGNSGYIIYIVKNDKMKTYLSFLHFSLKSPFDFSTIYFSEKSLSKKFEKATRDFCSIRNVRFMKNGKYVFIECNKSLRRGFAILKLSENYRLESCYDCSVFYSYDDFRNDMKDKKTIIKTSFIGDNDKLYYILGKNDGRNLGFIEFNVEKSVDIFYTQQNNIIRHFKENLDTKHTIFSDSNFDLKYIKNNTITYLSDDGKRFFCFLREQKCMFIYDMNENLSIGNIISVKKINFHDYVADNIDKEKTGEFINIKTNINDFNNFLKYEIYDVFFNENGKKLIIVMCLKEKISDLRFLEISYHQPYVYNYSFCNFIFTLKEKWHIEKVVKMNIDKNKNEKLENKVKDYFTNSLSEKISISNDGNYLIFTNYNAFIKFIKLPEKWNIYSITEESNVETITFPNFTFVKKVKYFNEKTKRILALSSSGDYLQLYRLDMKNKKMFFEKNIFTHEDKIIDFHVSKDEKCILILDINGNIMKCELQENL